MSDSTYRPTIPYVTTNPITGKTPTYYYYYYFNTPGKFSFSLPVQNIDLKCVIGGGGGQGGLAGTYGTEVVVPQNGGGGGGSGGQVITKTIKQEQDCIFIEIDVGDVGQETIVKYTDPTNNQLVKFTALPGMAGSPGESFTGKADNNLSGEKKVQYTGGDGADGYNGTGGIGGITKYTQKQQPSGNIDTSDYSACVSGTNGSGSGGGGGGPASWFEGKDGISGGSGGLGTSVTFYDSTDDGLVGYFCPGGKGGIGCSSNGTNSDGTYKTNSAAKGNDGSKGAVLIYFYYYDEITESSTWNALSLYPDNTSNTSTSGSKASSDTTKAYTATIQGGGEIPSLDLTITALAEISIKIVVPSDTIELGTDISNTQVQVKSFSFVVNNLEPLNGKINLTFQSPSLGSHTIIVTLLEGNGHDLAILNNILERIIPLPDYYFYYYKIETIEFILKAAFLLEFSATPKFSSLWLSIIFTIKFEIVKDKIFDWLTITFYTYNLYTYEMINN